MAEMGGFIQILFLIIYVITFPFRRKKYNEKIINSIYNFEKETNEEMKERQSRLHFFKKVKAPDKKKEKDDNTTNFQQIFNRINPYENKFVKFLMNIKNKIPLKLTISEFLYGFLSNNQNQDMKLKRFEKAISAIQEKLDVSYILKKFYELDKLKMLILDKDQYHLFEYLPKPVILKNAKIDLGDKNFTFISYETSKDVLGKIKKMYNAYITILKRKVN